METIEITAKSKKIQLWIKTKPDKVHIERHKFCVQTTKLNYYCLNRSSSSYCTRVLQNGDERIVLFLQIPYSFIGIWIPLLLEGILHNIVPAAVCAANHSYLLLSYLKLYTHTWCSVVGFKWWQYRAWGQAFWLTATFANAHSTQEQEIYLFIWIN